LSYTRAAFALSLALALLLVLWETVLAPLRPGGSWLALKAVPLALLLPGLAAGRARARQWASLLLPFYFAEGVARGLTEAGRHATVALATAAVSLAAFVAVLASFRARR
jgi:uncharacterized membrane protein